MSALKEQKTKRKRECYLAYDLVKAFATLPGLLWFRPKIHYVGPEAKKKIKGGALLIANHIGFFDPVYMMHAVWYRRHRFICLKEVMEMKFGWILKLFLCIPIDRENFGMDTFRQIVRHLEDGHLVSMFPEGHINDGSGKLGTFKSGMVLMAMKGGKPIVPMYVKKRAHFWQRLNVVMGEAVDITKIYGERPTFAQIEEITKLLYQKEEELKLYIEQEEV